MKSTSLGESNGTVHKTKGSGVPHESALVYIPPPRADNWSNSGSDGQAQIHNKIKDYNDNTSLHGPKYITEDGNHLVER